MRLLEGDGGMCKNCFCAFVMCPLLFLFLLLFFNCFCSCSGNSLPKHSQQMGSPGGRHPQLRMQVAAWGPEGIISPFLLSLLHVPGSISAPAPGEPHPIFQLSSSHDLPSLQRTISIGCRGGRGIFVPSPQNKINKIIKAA